MISFDSFVMVDWSGGNDRGLAPKKDAIWTCVARAGDTDVPVYHRNRQQAEKWLDDLISAELSANRRAFIAFDFPFGYPVGFAHALTGQDDPLALWDWLAHHISDTPRSNNRFDVAGAINARFSGVGPFWGNGLKRDIAHLPRKGLARCDMPFAERRHVETRAKGSFSCWQLAGAGSVGSQILMGLPVLARLRQRFAGQVSIWPFEALDAPIAFVEAWPGLINPMVRKVQAEGEIRDAAQVRLMAGAFSRLDPAVLHDMLDVKNAEEGWIFGLGYEGALMAAAKNSLQPPPLKNDCFALPPGVDWTPVAQAHAMLRDTLSCVVGAETLRADQALGRVLALPVAAMRSNPPQPNTAVDGYGFAGGSIDDGPQVLPLVEGRSAAGAPYMDIVPQGHAIRVLTGASLPEGVDTVILQEDVTLGDGSIAFHGALRAGVNTRKAGEDVAADTEIFPTGRRIRPADLALLSATGVRDVSVRKRLRVAVISTGDELTEAGSVADPHQIYDANRPMLLAMIKQFGFTPVDMGRAPDDRSALRALMDKAAQKADVILTSGGASAGDEDHVSALLGETGSMSLWRIAIKPGRPLALALWKDTPVFGLPGNPVAAMVCTLIFARPAMGALAGEGWRMPEPLMLPAAFEKTKKPGRREYLRARLRDGQVEVFTSEGSGRISGLSWAEGLVELPDEAAHISPGVLVRYYPYSAFGL